MPKVSKNTKTAEPFSAVAQRLGDSLADVISHPGCPEDVYNAVLQLDADIFNRCPDVEISLRYSFPRRLTAALERRA